MVYIYGLHTTRTCASARARAHTHTHTPVDEVDGGPLAVHGGGRGQLADQGVEVSVIIIIIIIIIKM